MALEAGDIVSRLLLDMSDFRRALKTAPGVAKKDLQKVNRALGTTMRQMDKSVEGFVRRSEAHGKKFEKGWWARFGAVAIGFTVAYRAMNVLERGLQKLSQTTLDAIRESGELASLQAKLALWTAMHSKGVIEYADAFVYARSTMLALMEASVTSLSSIEELSTGLDEMGQTLGTIRTETVGAAVDLIDFTVLVAQTTGSVTRQVRQEIQSLLQGQVRTTDIVIRTMRKMGVLTDENIAKLKDQIDVQETFDKVLVAISAHMAEFREQVLRTDVNKALAFWEKSIRVVLVESILLASVLENVGGNLEDIGNIFALELNKRAKEYRDSLTPEDIGRNIVAMQGLRNAFALGLDMYESTIRVAGILITVMTNLYDEISLVAKGLGGILAAMVVVKSFELLGKTALWLADVPVKLLTRAFHSLYIRMMLIPVAVAATAVALETLGDMFPDLEKKVKDAGMGLKDFLKDKLGDVAEDTVKGWETILTWILGKTKKVGEETAEFWTEPLGAFGRKYAENVKKHWEQLMAVLAPLMEQLKEMTSDVMTPDVDLETLMAQYKESLKVIEIGVTETEKKVEKLDLTRVYRKQFHRLRSIARRWYKTMITDYDMLQKDLGEIQTLADIGFFQSQEEKTRAIEVAVSRYLTKRLTLHQSVYEGISTTEAEYHRLSIELINQQAAAYKREKVKEGVIAKFVAEQKIRLNQRVRDEQIKQIADIKGFYEDIPAYALKTHKEELKILEIRAAEYEDLLSRIMTAEQAHLDAQKWFNEQKKEMWIDLVNTYATELGDRLRFMSDSLATFFQQMGRQSERAFEIYKMFAIASAIIDTIQSAVAAYLWGWKYGGPIAPYLSVAMAVVATLAGMARVAMIESQQFQAYAAGGWLDKHPGGGKVTEGTGRDDVFLGATPGIKHWIAKDEYVFVMNKEATKKHGASLEAMNRGLMGGGWINRGYFSLGDVLDPFDWFEEPSAPPPSLPMISGPELILEFRKMLDQTTSLEDALRSLREQLDDLRQRFVNAGATAKSLAWFEKKRIEVEEHLIAKMQDEAWTSISEKIADLLGVFSDFEKQVLDISKQFDDMVAKLEDVEMAYDDAGNATAELANVEAARVAAIRHLVEVQQDALRAELKERLAGIRLDPDRLAQMKLMKEFIETLEHIYEQAEVTGDDYSILIAEVVAAYEEQMEAAILQTEAAQALRDVANEWQSVADSIADAIWEMQTTLTSPADIQERMALVWQEIMDLEALGADTPEEVKKLQELYEQYLALAQEAYQRPSAEYREIYDTILAALQRLQEQAEAGVTDLQVQLDMLVAEQTQLLILEGMEVSLAEIAEKIMEGTDLDVNLTADDFNLIINDGEPLEVDLTTLNLPTLPDFTNFFGDVTNVEKIVAGNIKETAGVLRQIRANTFAIGHSVGHLANYQIKPHNVYGMFPPYARYGGTFVGPESGYPVMLHGIERVTPLGGAGGGAQFEMNLTINESRTPRETGAVVTDAIKGFFKSGQGRKIIQETSKGRG